VIERYRIPSYRDLFLPRALTFALTLADTRADTVNARCAPGNRV
jgi:hypothetical protein